jgi:hypothetical protein
MWDIPKIYLFCAPPYRKDFEILFLARTHCKWFRVPRSIADITRASAFSHNTSGQVFLDRNLTRTGVSLPSPLTPHDLISSEGT